MSKGSHGIGFAGRQVGLRLAALALLLACSRPAPSQEVAPAFRDLPVSQWLAEGDRHDIPSKVTFAPARLLFDQRHLVEVRVRVDTDRLQKTSVHRHLYLVLTAADASGHWLHDTNGMDFELTQPLDRNKELEFVGRMLVRPGRHLFALILYDSVLGQRSVMRSWVRVPDIRHDPLPEVGREFPEVEFLPNAGGSDQNAPTHPVREPDAKPPRDGVARRGSGRRRGRDVAFPPADIPRDSGSPEPPTSDSGGRIPVAAANPLEIDVLVDFTPSWQFAGSAPAYRHAASVFRQVTHMLSLLQPEPGCVRLTGIDVLGQRVLFEGMDGNHVEWSRVDAALAGVNPATVDVASLQGRTRMAEFFRAQVTRLLQQPDAGCLYGNGQGPLQRVYVIAASGIVFPNGTQRVPVDPMPGSEVRMYYLRATLARDAVWDDMEKIVRPLHPRLLTIDTPLQFRKALATIVTDLRAQAAAPSGRP